MDRFPLRWRLSFAAFVSLAITCCSAIPSYRSGADDGGRNDAGPALDAAGSDGAQCARKPPGAFFRFFVTDGAYNGNLFGPDGDVRKVDALCQGAGEARWKDTRWLAYFWFDATVHPSSRLVDVCDGWFAEPNNGSPYRMFANKAALRDEPEGLPNVTEKGDRVSGAMQIWTGGSATEPMNRCGGWREVGAGYEGTTGSPTDRERWMRDDDSRGCEAAARIYCFEQP